MAALRFKSTNTYILVLVELLRVPGSLIAPVLQYAGFISKHCAKYLRKGGILLANNSHGDAPLAYLNKGFEFIGVASRNANSFRFSESALDSYFIQKGKKVFDTETIEKALRGPSFTKTAYAYVFRKLS